MSRRITPPAPPVSLPPGTVLLTVDGKREYAISADDRALLLYFGNTRPVDARQAATVAPPIYHTYERLTLHLQEKK